MHTSQYDMVYTTQRKLPFLLAKINMTIKENNLIIQKDYLNTKTNVPNVPGIRIH